MSENRRIEKLVGAARDLLERRIRLPVVHPTPKLDQRRSADVCQAYVWLARTADKCLRLRSGAEIIPWSLGLRGSARDAEEDESAAEGTHRRIASLGEKRHGHRHLARHPERTSGPVNAVHHNCACEFGLMGVRLSTCASHHMLNEDQRALDGLLFGRRIAGRLSDEEGLDTYQRAIEGSRELLAGLHNGGRPGIGNAVWGWASVAPGRETGKFNSSR